MRMTADGHMGDQSETKIPLHYCVVGYKNNNI